jgi:hypothetical protein
MPSGRVGGVISPFGAGRAMNALAPNITANAISINFFILSLLFGLVWNFVPFGVKKSEGFGRLIGVLPFLDSHCVGNDIFFI